MNTDTPSAVCLFCGGDASEVGHLKHCDGRQGFIEADETPDFDGETYDADRDHDRLQRQLLLVLGAVRDQGWHTLAELETKTGAPQASISARLRDLRKAKFGGHVVERRYVQRGLWEYRFLPATKGDAA